MSIFDKLLERIGYIPKAAKVTLNVTEYTSDAVNGKMANLAKATVVKLYEAFKKLVTPRNVDLYSPDTKLSVVANALKIETYFRRAKDRYIELILKNGFSFVGINKKAVDYVKQRFQEIAYVTQKPTRLLFEEILNELIPFYNCFVVKVRNERSSSGNSWVYFGKKVKPIAGYFVVSCLNMTAVIDKKERVLLGWNYDDDVLPKEEFKDFRDVIHMALDREPGKIFGTPPAYTVLDDIRALRRMEENVELLVFQYAIPLYQYSIGTEKDPATTNEIQVARSEVESMLTQGMLVTPERHKITAIGAEREALNVGPYLEYFKTRILTGLGHSLVSIGETGGTTRATATTLNKTVIDAATRLGGLFKMFVEEFMINELLQEGGFDIFDEKNKVSLYLEDIDVDDKIRKEFHQLALYQGNVITEDEMRAKLGRAPFTNADRAKTYFELVLKPKALILSSDEIFDPSNANDPATKTKQVPTNQYGPKKTGPTQRTGGDSIVSLTNITDNINTNPYEKVIKEYHEMFLGQYRDFRADVLEAIRSKSINAIKISAKITQQIIAEKASAFLYHMYRSGVERVGLFDNIPVDEDMKIIHRYHMNSVIALFNSVLEKVLVDGLDVESIAAIFDAEEYRVKFIVDWYVRKSYWMGIAASKIASGARELRIVSHGDESDICKEHETTFKVDKMYIHKIPPYHSFCNCEIAIDK